MNREQFEMLFRTLLQVLGAFAVGKGWVSGEDWVTYSAGGLTIAVTIWGFVARNNKNLVNAAAKVPEVSAIITTPEMAAKAFSSKVIDEIARRVRT